MLHLPLLRLSRRLVLPQIVQLLRAQRTTRVGLLNGLPLLVEARPRGWWHRLVEERTLRLRRSHRAASGNVPRATARAMHLLLR